MIGRNIYIISSYIIFAERFWFKKKKKWSNRKKKHAILKIIRRILKNYWQEITPLSLPVATPLIEHLCIQELSSNDCNKNSARRTVSSYLSSPQCCSSAARRTGSAWTAGRRAARTAWPGTPSPSGSSGPRRRRPSPRPPADTRPCHCRSTWAIAWSPHCCSHSFSSISWRAILFFYTCTQKFYWVMVASLQSTHGHSFLAFARV